jgi:hypothetical protein
MRLDQIDVPIDVFLVAFFPALESKSPPEATSYYSPGSELEVDTP